MTIQLKKISEQVIVNTGATSGIGLTTARMVAKRKLVPSPETKKATPAG